MIQQKKLEFLRLSFLIAGHTKFSPDLLFSKIAQSYNRSDVFTTEELKQIICPYAEVIIDEGMLVCDWRNLLSNKFSKHPGIRSQHDFVFSLKSSCVETKVRQLCYDGAFENSSSHVLRGRHPSQSIIPDPIKYNYSQLGKTRLLSDSKMKNLQQMYHDFIPKEQWPMFD